MKAWNWLERWPLWLLRAVVAIGVLVGGLLLTLLLVFSLNPETPVKLALDNESNFPVAVRYDWQLTTVPGQTEWDLESDDDGAHVVHFTPARAPIRFEFSFSSATWNAKSFSFEFDVFNED